MSYQIVRGLKIKMDVKEVWINSASNNVYPRTYHWEKYSGLTRILNEEDGERKVKMIILNEYWGGNFQTGNPNVYSRAAAYVRDSVEWGTVGEVKTKDLVEGPLEALPKYINAYHARDRDIVRRRLSGEVIDLSTIERPTLTTEEELSELLWNALQKKLYINKE